MKTLIRMAIHSRLFRYTGTLHKRGWFVPGDRYKIPTFVELTGHDVKTNLMLMHKADVTFPLGRLLCDGWPMNMKKFVYNIITLQL